MGYGTSAPGRASDGFLTPPPPTLSAHRNAPAPCRAEDGRAPLTSTQSLRQMLPYGLVQVGGTNGMPVTVTRPRLAAPDRAGDLGSRPGLAAASAPGQPAGAGRCSCRCSASVLGQLESSGSLVGPLDLSLGHDSPAECGFAGQSPPSPAFQISSGIGSAARPGGWSSITGSAIK